MCQRRSVQIRRIRVIRGLSIIDHGSNGFNGSSPILLWAAAELAGEAAVSAEVVISVERFHSQHFSHHR